MIVPPHEHHHRPYTTLGQSESAHLISSARDASLRRPLPTLDHRVDDTWNVHDSSFPLHSVLVSEAEIR